MSVVLAAWEAEMGKIEVQSQARQIVCKTLSISKITRAKWTGGVTQVIECLFYRHEALSHQKKQKQKKTKKKSLTCESSI
jgi:hypothetical protein